VKVRLRQATDPNQMARRAIAAMKSHDKKG
jgi:hypothetical protein